MRFSIFLLTLLLPLLLYAQKNRISFGYHQAYIIERDDLAKIGQQISLERVWGNKLITTISWSRNEDCLCDVVPYEYGLISGRYSLMSSSPQGDIPAHSRFRHRSFIASYRWTTRRYPSISYALGTGIVYRTGGETYFIDNNLWQTFAVSRISTDWAIPVRIHLRYEPPRQWWGFTAFVLYQGYFDYAKEYGNNPMNVLHAGLNFDIRLGKREELRTK